MKTVLRKKLDESLGAVLPIVAIVLLLSLTTAPMPAPILLSFLLSGVLVIVGMMLFSVGADMAMQPMGERMGARITKTRRLWLILLLGFLLGCMITVSEPDLQVLAGQVQSIPNAVLILSVGVGVGLFLVVALLRMLFGAPLQYLLIGFYALVIVLSAFAPAGFRAVAFDAGGVTTGPMTVPFIMAFGIGISAIRNDRRAADDSFGLIALCSIGPILSVLVLSLIYHPEDAAYTPAVLPDVSESVALGRLFVDGIPHYMGEVALALLPIAVFFGIFQIVSLRLGKKPLCRILIGILYTYVGLVLFLTGVNVGFSPAGSYLGGVLAGLSCRWIIVPIGMVIGYFIVRAEPAVYVLMTQVEELTDGAITGKVLQRTLSIGVSAAVGLAMLRVLSGVSILWIVVPGYAVALLLSFFSPKIFTAIAFDSGGVASGPMTATFLLPFAVGACLAVGGEVVTDAFGVVALVAMTPLIAIQILGIVYRVRSGAPVQKEAPEPSFDDDAIIEL